MLKPLKNSIYELSLKLDRVFNLHIFPRDRIMCAVIEHFESIHNKKLFIDFRTFDFDMFYYISSFEYKKQQFFCFHATKMTHKGDVSYIIVCDISKKMMFQINAPNLGFRHFYSPQVFFEDNKLNLYFTAQKSNQFHLYVLDISDFNTSHTPIRLKKNTEGEQHIFKSRGQYGVLFTAKSGLVLYTTKNLHKYTRQKINLISKEKYLLINNPSIITFNNKHYLFCRVSQKNALESHIVCFESKNLSDFHQNAFELRPDQSNYEKHGTAFPYVVKEGKIFKLYYTSFWGRHILEKYTLKLWEKT